MTMSRSEGSSEGLQGSREKQRVVSGSSKAWLVSKAISTRSPKVKL
jgi:hypothetical protein